ncbi:MAG: hypothetical protein M1416_01365 [Candidatus Pacearchaeota archaeon]|nr:hypothetical protein [Candidatus Pacearchaeota archaeon]
MKKRGMKKYFLKRGKENGNKNHCTRCGGCCGGGIYFLGLIGSAVYFIQQANGFWEGVLGLLKALVWPAFLVYKLFGM